MRQTVAGSQASEASSSTVLYRTGWVDPRARKAPNHVCQLGRLGDMLDGVTFRGEAAVRHAGPRRRILEGLARCDFDTALGEVSGAGTAFCEPGRGRS